MKVIVFYEDGYKQMYDVEKISSETLKQIMEKEEGALAIYRGEILDVENPILPIKTKEAEIWENLKREALNKTFADMIEIMAEDKYKYLWLILNRPFEENGSEYLPLVMDIYSEELIAYKVNSCIDGEIKGSFEIIKAPIDILKVAEEAQDYDYNFWRKYWEKEIAHDLICSDEYFEGKALKKIITDVKHIYATSNKQSAFYMAKNYLIETLIYDRDILKYTLLNESNRVYFKIDDIELFDKEEIHSVKFMNLKNKKEIKKIDMRSNNYHIRILNPKYNDGKCLEIEID
nr:MAG TPA: hypothetical protein [Caudoviricetes sp.]